MMRLMGEVMMVSRYLSRSLAALGLVLSLTAAAAMAQPASDFKPQVGQRGKDVIWVPTPQSLVDRMLEIAKVTPNDYVVDLGSGDGRTVITAAKLGAKALGIEYNPDMVELSRRNADKAGVGDRAKFVKADIFESDFSQATVVTMFLLSSLNIKLRPIILKMKPGTRVVSNTFDMGDWKPDETVRAAGDCTYYCKAFFWVVPAKVEGKWQLGRSELTLRQNYQFLQGNLTTGNVVAPIAGGKLEGDRIVFKAGGTQYSGRVTGDSMQGTAKTGTEEAKWQATRK
jgi:SAM-dependent methyltransferase